MMGLAKKIVCSPRSCSVPTPPRIPSDGARRGSDVLRLRPLVASPARRTREVQIHGGSGTPFCRHKPQAESAPGRILLFERLFVVMSFYSINYGNGWYSHLSSFMKNEPRLNTSSE